MARRDEPRCKQRTASRRRCKRRAQWDGFCFQHWRMAIRNGLLRVFP